MTKPTEKPKTLPPHFKYINAVIHTKQDVLEDEKDYKAFMVNRGLSFELDCIEKANEMNMNHHLEPRLQFDYLINKIRSRKRYIKWFKKEKDDDLKLVMEYYGYNVSKAKTALSILSADQLKTIKEIMTSKE